MTTNNVNESMENARRARNVTVANQKIVEREYWYEKLGENPVKSLFLPDYKRNDGERVFKSIPFPLSVEANTMLERMSKNSDPKLFIILVAGLTALIYKYYASTEILIGAPMYKQENDADFINTVLLLKGTIKEGMTFKQLLLEMKDNIVNALKYRNYPVEILAEQLVKPFSPDEDFPLLDISLMLENIHDKNYLRNINHNMAISFTRADGNVDGTLFYNTSIYKQATIAGIMEHFNRLLEAALSNPDICLDDIRLLTQAEQKNISEDYNDTTVEYPTDKLVHEMFRDQVASAPGNLAVTGPNLAGSSVEYSYGRLNERANRLASFLLSQKVGPDTIVAIMAEPSVEMFVGLLAILKAGGAYLPLDPSYPPDRVDYILGDSGARFILTHGQHRFEGFEGKIIDLNDTAVYTGDGKDSEAINRPG
ncbi:MAG: AMP-binding protein, partial [bacterium]|nr:AMP-binding protein [bacterium]